ncbi:MAG: RNA-binding S4 domain-containing protein [Erysipelotrichales bacterium]|nr:RNA-binding S4 domain-containing protein [Erysipelotrichales bacterium]
MRLDKYLKVSRILKRRTISKEMADSERVYVNGKAAKPSYTVKIGDEVAIIFGQKKLTVRVMMLKENIKKEEASDLYEIISEEYINELE